MRQAHMLKWLAETPADDFEVCAEYAPENNDAGIQECGLSIAPGMDLVTLNGPDDLKKGMNQVILGQDELRVQQ